MMGNLSIRRNTKLQFHGLCCFSVPYNQFKSSPDSNTEEEEYEYRNRALDDTCDEWPSRTSLLWKAKRQGTWAGSSSCESKVCGILENKKKKKGHSTLRSAAPAAWKTRRHRSAEPSAQAQVPRLGNSTKMMKSKRCNVEQLCSLGSDQHAKIRVSPRGWYCNIDYQL
jgi:hypothetical protein